MIPAYWGEPAWVFLERVAASYPYFPKSDDKDNYRSFFMLLQNILPCANCSKHFSENLVVNPLDEYALLTPQNLVLWLVRMHNLVNIQTGKAAMPLEQTVQNILQKGLSANKLDWQEDAWKFLHSVTLEYPTAPTQLDKEKYRLFFNLLQYTLPVDFYKQAYIEALSVYPLTDEVMASQTNLFNWSSDVHNKVNEILKLPTVPTKNRLLTIIQEQEQTGQQIQAIAAEQEIQEAFNNMTNDKTMTLAAIIIMIIAIVTALACIAACNRKYY
jgi:hypothetical protein